MTKFIKWMQLSEMFFNEVVKEIFKTNFPNLKYSAWLIGHWSEVLWFDTERSTDHHWWPRVMLFLNEKDFSKKDEISEVFSKELPSTFHWYSTHFSSPNPNDNGVQHLSEAKEWEPINHRIEILTIKDFFEDDLWIDPNKEFTISDWLTFPEQKLRTIKSGKIFHDDLWLKEIQKKFEYYPIQVWYYLLASEWSQIWQEEAFIWRCWEVEDELWSRIIATRIIHSIMRLCFFMEKEYAPYSKWFGTGFSKLKSAKKLTHIFHKIFSSENWKEREKYMSEAYEIVATMHNNLNITDHIEIKTSNYYGRPFLVIHWDVFSEKIKKLITDKDILKIKSDIGSVNQFTNNVNLLENNDLLNKVKRLYK